MHLIFKDEIVQRVILGYTKSIEKRNPFALMHNKKSNLLKTPFAFLLLLYTPCAFRPAILWKPHFIFTTSYDYFKLLPRLRLAFLHVFYLCVLKERKTDFTLLDLKSEIHIILISKAWFAHCIIQFSRNRCGLDISFEHCIDFAMKYWCAFRCTQWKYCFSSGFQLNR